MWKFKCCWLIYYLLNTICTCFSKLIFFYVFFPFSTEIITILKNLPFLVALRKTRTCIKTATATLNSSGTCSAVFPWRFYIDRSCERWNITALSSLFLILCISLLFVYFSLTLVLWLHASSLVVSASFCRTTIRLIPDCL